MLRLTIYLRVKYSTKFILNMEIVVYRTLVLAYNILPLLEIILSRGPIYVKTLNKSSASCIVLIILYTR
jgi:hypothetical protein